MAFGWSPAGEYGETSWKRSLMVLPDPVGDQYTGTPGDGWLRANPIRANGMRRRWSRTRAPHHAPSPARATPMPSRRPVPGPSHAGFGLLQMLVATLVLAVLYSLALPSFRHVLDTLHADSLRMQLVSVFATARSTAITRRQRIEACPSSDGQTCGEDWSHGWLLYPT